MAYLESINVADLLQWEVREAKIDMIIEKNFYLDISIFLVVIFSL